MRINAIPLAVRNLATRVADGISVARPAARGQRLFLFYLALVLLSILGSIIAWVGFSPDQEVWHRGLLVVFAATAAVYYHFTRALLDKRAGWSIYLAYTLLVVLAVFIGLGALLPESYPGNANLSSFFAGIIAVVFVGMAVPGLARGLEKAPDPHIKNVIAYLLLGVTILALAAGINLVLSRGQYLLPSVSHLFNALVIGYAIWKPQPADAAFVIRRSIAYLVVLLCIGAVFAGVIYLYYYLLPGQPLYSTVLMLSSMALLLALATRPLRLTIEKRMDWVFYRETNTYRNMLLNFGSRLGSIINLEELANEILPAMSKALLVKHAKLLVEDDKGYFTAQFSFPKEEERIKDKLRFSTDSPLVTWLGRGNTSIQVAQISSTPELRGLPAAENEQINTANLDLLCPIKSRGKLVGILALGKKQSGTAYSYRDTQLITATTGQIGVLIENARLYSQALSWALTDGLTGLYNHRHFHNALEQEIARCTRYNEVLSLVMLDVDLFKAYNDTFGHPAGDKVLRGVGECILASIRTVDTAFRYGGEEFAVILPETPLENAQKVAERIRETIETNLSSRMTAVTASLGIASWPGDGAAKEEIIACADAALYLAKQTGRNRTCLSSDLAKSHPLAGAGAQEQVKAMSTVYALAAAVDAKDHYTFGHSTKVSDYAVTLAESLGFAPGKIAAIRVAALLHDVGKIGMPDSILKKDGPLSDEETEVVKIHPKQGVEIVKRVVELNDCLPAILHHHERLDGQGYPSGLQGDAIPIEARILTIADAYDALTSRRRYHERELSPAEAIQELQRCAGTQFDPALVDAFGKIMDKK